GAIDFGFVVTCEEAFGLTRGPHPYRLKIAFKKGPCMVAIQFAGCCCAFTRLEQSAQERPRRTHCFVCVENGATTIEKRCEGGCVVVILPAVESKKGYPPHMRITKA